MWLNVVTDSMDVTYRPWKPIIGEAIDRKYIMDTIKFRIQAIFSLVITT